MITVEIATDDLIHALSNYLNIVGEAHQARQAGAPCMMDDGEVGRYAMNRAPILRAALDSLRGAMSAAKIEADDEPARDYCSLCGQWKT